MKPPVRIRITPPDRNPYDFVFDGDSMIIGRASDADLPIPDRFLSRHHARLFVRDNRILIEDLGSRNGTFLNGVQVQQPSPVSSGDRVEICSTSLVINDSAGSPLPPSRPQEDSMSSMTVYRPVSDFLQSRAQADSKDSSEQNLRRYTERLQMLNEVHHALGRSMELEELLELILDRIFAHLGPEEGAIFLRQPDGDMLRAAARSTKGSKEDVFYSRKLVHEVTEKGVAALVLDATVDERFAASESLLAAGVRSLAAAPLLDEEEALGMIAIGSRVAVRAFSEEDLEILISLAAVAALRLRNVKLAEEAARRRVLEKELALARRIQIALLPATLPEVTGWSLHAGTQPSRTVSGDYYQVLTRGERGTECMLMVADVSGKGVAASLLTASIEALTAGPIEDGKTPVEICDRVSGLLYRRTPPEKYATAFLAAVDTESGELFYVNAGHNPAFLIRAEGEIEPLSATGTPLGLVPGATYRQESRQLAPGDLLAIYTDGAIEVTDPSDEEFGEERLRQIFVSQRAEPLADLAQALEKALYDFSRGAALPDDLTLVTLRRDA